MIQFLFGLMLLLIGIGVCNAVTPIITPMDDFWLQHGPVSANDLHHMYGPSNPAGTWSVGQWGTHPPSSEMLPFAPFPCNRVATNNTGLSNCARAVGTNNMVTRFTAGGTVFAQLQSQGINQPCVAAAGQGGDPYELDLGLGAVATDGAHDPGYPQGVLNQPFLSGLTALTYSATVTVKYVGMNVLNRCPTVNGNINQAIAIMMAATFNNGTQVLFYQLALGRFGYVSQGAGTTYFFEQTAPTFGFADDISTYGGSNQMTALNVPITYSFNILPQIKTIITTASNGLNTNLSTWHVGGMYIIHVTYGNIGAITEWSNIGYAGTQ